MPDIVSNIHFYIQKIAEVNGLPFTLDIVLRLLASVMAGAIVGLERKKRLKEAGIRTHCMVSVGAAIFAIVSKYGFLDVVWIDGIQADAGRISANIVTGVCFLGAGMIFVRSKSIKGLTTAAGIWAVSAIGLAFGAGMYFLGCVSSVLIILIQYILYKPLLSLEGASISEVVFKLNSMDNVEELNDIINQIDSSYSISMLEKKDDGTVVVNYNVRIPYKCPLNEVYDFMKKYPFIKSMSK